MVEKSRKGGKFNKTQRGVDRQFSNPKELERETWRRDQREEAPEGNEDDSDRKSANPAANFIKVENLNRGAKLSELSLDDLAQEEEEEQEEDQPMNRREREALQKQQAAARYQKLTEEGKTPQAKKDLERLALIRKHREDAKRKKDEEVAAKESKKQESLNAGKGIIGKSLGKK